MEDSKLSLAGYTRRLVVAAMIVVATVAFCAALIYATEIFLVLVLAVLFGVFLCRCSTWLSSLITLNYGWCLGIVTTGLVLLGLAGLLLFGVQINTQVEKAYKHFDQVESQVQQLAEEYPALETALANTPVLRKLVEDPQGKSKSEQESSPDKDSSPEDSPEKKEPEDKDKSASEAESGDKKSNGKSQKSSKPLPEEVKSVAGRVGATLKTVFGTTMGFFVNSLVIFFVGLFLAVAPDQYRDGVVQLFPPPRRDRVRGLMNGVGDTMWHWLVGRFGSMLVTGTGAGIILLILGVPLAISLGVITALLTFIPNIGGFLALSMSVLCAVPQGGTTVALVIAGYLLLQLIESYVVTPLIQQRQVSLPPALLIFFQALMGVLFGFLGAAVASPVLAAVKYLVEEAYIKDVLEDSEPKNENQEQENA